jgi:hypothetical protein
MLYLDVASLAERNKIMRVVSGIKVSVKFPDWDNMMHLEFSALFVAFSAILSTILTSIVVSLSDASGNGEPMLATLIFAASIVVVSLLHHSVSVGFVPTSPATKNSMSISVISRKMTFVNFEFLAAKFAASIYEILWSSFRWLRLSRREFRPTYAGAKPIWTTSPSHKWFSAKLTNILYKCCSGWFLPPFISTLSTTKLYVIIACFEFARTIFARLDWHFNHSDFEIPRNNCLGARLGEAHLSKNDQFFQARMYYTTTTDPVTHGRPPSLP